MKHICTTIFASMVVLSICSCGGGGGGGKSKPSPDVTAPDIHIDALGMRGTLSEPATVTVNGVADEDAVDDDAFTVLLPMGTGSLPADPAEGSSANGVLEMTATDAATNMGGQDVDVTIHH